MDPQGSFVCKLLVDFLQIYRVVTIQIFFPVKGNIGIIGIVSLCLRELFVVFPGDFFHKE